MGAARNILIDSNFQIKISNINIVRKEWKNDYYNPHEGYVAPEDNHAPGFVEPSQSLIPVRWMSPESLLSAKYNIASDVWSYAVCCWEIFSLGTQPWLGYTNEEVMEIVIDRKQVLPCPEPCPLQIYNLLINCWAYQANARPPFVRISGFLDQFRKSAKDNVRKQYGAASTVSYNSQSVYGGQQQRNMYHQQQVYSQQLPSSTDNSTVGVPPFMPGGVGGGANQIVPTPSPSHQMVQSRQHQAPPASPAVSHSHYRYPAGGTRSTTGSSTAGDSTGYVATVPEELLRPLIPNQQSPQMHHVVAPSSTASSSLYRAAANPYAR